MVLLLIEGNTTVTLVNGTANFVFGVVLNERLCPQHKVSGKVANDTNDLVIQKLKYKYENLKLVVEHKCKGKKQKVSMMLPTIDVFKMTGMVDRVLQLRDLKLNLTSLEVGATLNQSATEMKDPKSGIYLTVSVVDKNTTMAPTGKTPKPTKMPPTKMSKPTTVTDKNMTTMAPTGEPPKPPLVNHTEANPKAPK
uniref:Pollen Ole e 1 allergen and extensin family protein n=1 Tax=Globodera pallida TaxID=36090 RepID=A0A183C895_GLOPA